MRYLILQPFGQDMANYARSLWESWAHFTKHEWVLAILEQVDAQRQFWCIVRVDEARLQQFEDAGQGNGAGIAPHSVEAVLADLLKGAAIATGALRAQTSTRMTAAMREGLNSDSESLAVVAREWLQRGLVVVKSIEFRRAAHQPSVAGHAPQAPPPLKS